jgi:spermidine synthase
MELPQIGQAEMLADELASAVRQHSPASVAIIGCSGGNGFDRLDTSGVERIVGIDINPDYVETARRRYAKRFHGLELYVADIQDAVPM